MLKSTARWSTMHVKQRDELFSNAEHNAVPGAKRRFATAAARGLQRDRVGHLGAAGCALAVAARCCPPAVEEAARAP